MPRAQVGDIEIEYESFGKGEPLLLIMGIAAQMLLWHDAFCERLAARGYQVVRFDNRDVGRSTWLDGAPVPQLRPLLLRSSLGLPVSATYTLSDMASDAVGLLDHLGWSRAHIVGASMGGMIAQHLAIEHPQRVTSLVSLMSTSGSRRGSLPQPRALRALLGDRPRNADDAEAWMLRFVQTVQGPGFPVDEVEVRDLARRCWDHGNNPPGFLRHFAAILASGDRSDRLRQVRAPTLVLHGSADPLVPLRGGREVAAAIPGARLQIIEGLGHGLPSGAWPTLLDAIAGHAASGRGAA